MTAGTPEVSVVIGAYNAGKELEPTLASVLTQEGVELEVIVVNDGSTDDTSPRLRELSAKDPRVQVLEQENLGLTAALIHGCELAQGRYIARQDIGDRSLPGRLAKQKGILESDPGIAMVTCGYRQVGPCGEIMAEVLPPYSAERWTDLLRSGDQTRLEAPHHGSVVFRKDAYESVGGYRFEFYFAQDLDLWTRLVEVGSLSFVRELLYRAAFDYDSISVRHGDQQRRLRSLIAKAAQYRARGDPEDELLQHALELCKHEVDVNTRTASRMQADYFVGSCLYARRNRAARRYLRRVLLQHPFHAKALAKLLLSFGHREL